MAGTSQDKTGGEESIEVEEVALPGIGLRDDFVTSEGRRVGVVSHRTGRRDLCLYAEGDPDAASATVRLTPGEADTLAEFLATRRLIERLARLTEQVTDLDTRKVPVAPGSRYAGQSLGSAKVRSRTGASIVAVLRHGEAIASPTPDFILADEDQLIVVGTQDALTAVDSIMRQ
ncbi:MAG TPA: TrkA C-terminal domain-containing protein [Ruania sp.]|nr:TrkA C-terminal domain-containing protein [Ruania sp.]